MRQWVPSKRQFVSDLAASFVLMIIVYIVVWAVKHARDSGVASVPWEAIGSLSRWQAATIVLAGVALVCVLQVCRILRRVRPATRVSSDGFEWILDGWSGENRMILRSLCPAHQVQILFKDNSGNVQRMSGAKNLEQGRLYCPAAVADDAHPVDLAESKTWDSAVQLAATRMQAVLDRGRK
jgi:hypothetical protein